MLQYLSEEEVIAKHSQPEYTVWGIGFLPGFPYLGELPESLVLPRKAVPSKRVAAGSVAIAGRQTGIYPCLGESFGSNSTFLTGSFGGFEGRRLPSGQHNKYKKQ